MDTTTENGGRLKRVFTSKQMTLLKKYLKEIDLKFFGMTKTQCKRLVYEFAERNGVDHPFNKEARMAGDDWLGSFMKEFRFTVRPHEASQSLRGAPFDQLQVDGFFRILSRLRRAIAFRPEKIYHADEICISAVPNDLTRFCSSSQLKGRGSGRLLVETRDNVTLVCCASATGSYIPPMIVFPRDKMIPGFLRGLPSGSIGYTSERGLINSELFLTFLKHFVQHALPSCPYPALLLVDNYISYISLEALDFCTSNNVALMGFPPHSRQKLQPLDLSFFGPLKTCYSHACDGFSDAYPRVKLTVDNVGEVFRTAYCRTATPTNAIKGFEESGIEPFRPELHCCPEIFENFEKYQAPDISDPTGVADTKSSADDSDIKIISWSSVETPAPNGLSDKGPEPEEKGDIFEGTAEGNGESIVCLRCDGHFRPRDWIQCPACKQWWHRDCKGSHKGVHCDYCIESMRAIVHHS